RHDIAMIVARTGGLHQVLRSILVARIDPPLGTVRRIDLGSGPGEFVIAGGRYLLAGPLTPMEGQIAEARMFPRRGEDAAEALTERSDLAFAADLLPGHPLQANRIEDALLHEGKQVHAGRAVEDEDQVGHARIAVIEDRPRVALERGER